MIKILATSLSAVALCASMSVQADVNTQQASAAMEHAAASLRQAFALAPVEMKTHCGHALEQAAETYPGALDLARITEALCSHDSAVNLREMLLAVAKMLENS